MQIIDVSLGQQVKPMEPSQQKKDKKPADLLRSTMHITTPFDQAIPDLSCVVTALAK